MTGQRAVVVQTSLDDLRSDDVRFLQEASTLGPLHVHVPSDELLAQQTGAAARFPAAERLFLAQSMRWVERATVVEHDVSSRLAALASDGASLVVREEDHDASVESAAQASGVPYRIVPASARAGFPDLAADEPAADVPRVVVTGCFDWLHSGHIRFFMDAAAYGALYVVVGSDRNVELLKGTGHPLQHEEERQYMVGSMRAVHRCLVSTGSGWMDAEPEIDDIKPTYYVVNEDGDQREKREFCATHSLEYVVLRRVPQTGLPARSSTDLRGF
jgi:cytidyltransferase-like protein